MSRGWNRGQDVEEVLFRPEWVEEPPEPSTSPEPLGFWDSLAAMAQGLSAADYRAQRARIAAEVEAEQRSLRYRLGYLAGRALAWWEWRTVGVLDWIGRQVALVARGFRNGHE